jgi:FkbM family methyltransferase
MSKTPLDTLATSYSKSRFSGEIGKRIELAVNCHDCDDIPKIEDAGQTCSGGGEYQLMHNGLKILTGQYHGEWMTEIIRRTRGHHEPQEEKAFYTVLKSLSPGSVMVELGSYWSYYSMWFQKELGSTVNYMIEPNVEKLTTGQRNFKLNGMEGTFLNAFVGLTKQKNSIFTDWDGTQTETPQISIDEFVREYDIHHIDLLHADIQGSEYDMLRGGKAAIADKRIKYFFISTHGYQHEKCLAFLARYGYQVICSHTIAESYSGDGLIVARAEKYDGVQFIDISKRYVPAWQRWSHYCRLKVKQLLTD